MTIDQGNVVPITAPPYAVVAQPGTRLAQLHELYAGAKAKADAAAEELKAVTDGIKAELAASAPEGSTKVDLLGEGRTPLRLDYRESWRIDSRKLKATEPETYVRYARKSGAWYLVPLAPDAGGDS